jgi:hypothetical protein
MRKSELRQIIREEIKRTQRLNEGFGVNTTYDASWKIAQLHGMKNEYVLNFMYDNNIDGVKLYSDIKKGKFENFEVMAMFVGDRGNDIQKMLKSMYKKKLRLSAKEAKAYDSIIHTLVTNDVDVLTARKFLTSNRIDFVKLGNAIKSFKFPYDLIGAVNGTNKMAAIQIQQEYR